MAGKPGNINILEDDDDPKGASRKDESLVLLRKLEGDPAIKLLALFSKEIDGEIDFHNNKSSMKIYKDKDQNLVMIKGRADEIKTADAIITRWNFLLDELNRRVITPVSYNNNVINIINELIQKMDLESHVVAIPSAQTRLIRLYGKNPDHLEQVEKRYKNPDVLAENACKFPENKLLNSSGRDRKEDRKSGSFRSTNANIKFQFVVKGLTVKLYKEAITKVEVDAIVNAANDDINNCGGVAEVISKAAGESMNRECKDFVRRYGRVRDAFNIVTSAGKLSYKYKGIIHAVGPRWHVYKDRAECLRVLAETIQNILETASGNNYRTIAMPPISSGIFAVPKEMCAAMYIKGILDFCQKENKGSFKEFHIIDIYDDVLDMIQKWYLRWEREPSCLEPNKVLIKCSENPAPSNQRKSRFSPSGQQASGFSKEGNGKYNYNEHGAKRVDNLNISKGLVFKFMENIKIHIFTANILDLRGIDCVVVSEDPMIKGEGGLSRALLSEGGKEYQKEHKNLQPYTSFTAKGQTKVVQSKGGNLPFSHVFHAIIRREFGENEKMFQKKLSTTFFNVLLKANVLKKGGGKLAFPMIGLGTNPTDDRIRSCCWTLKDAIQKFFLNKSVTTFRLSDIYLVNNQDVITQTLQETFRSDLFRAPPTSSAASRSGSWYKKEGQPSDSHAYSSDINRKPEAKHDSNKMSGKFFDKWKMKSVKRSDVSIYTERYQKPTKQRTGNLMIMNDDNDEDENVETTCVVCMCEFDTPVAFKKCKHVFCLECITEVFQTRPACPVCGTVYGEVFGDQPRDGTATIYKEDEPLPGCGNNKTWVIYYDIPDGTQKDFHPREGTPYEGIKRRAFLPASEEGTEVLKLFKRAFEQGLTFTIGTSRTTGKEGVITWNDIHHKTSRAGGPQKFGFPDPEYLGRVKEELASKGVTADSL